MKINSSASNLYIFVFNSVGILKLHVYSEPWDDSVSENQQVMLTFEMRTLFKGSSGLLWVVTV